MVVALSITLTLLVTLVVALSSHGASLDRYAADGDVSDECTVAFDRGLAIGTRRKTFGGMAYCAYEGIPYVQPPIGKLRFEDPQPYHFEGARFFRNVSKACPQAFTDDIYKLETSEDCLYLNVYTRKQGLWSTKQNSSRSMMPILLWIHGGSFVVGSSETDIFGPEFLVEKGIIVVTFNYRLAMLGFLSLPDLGINANLGLLDQLEALRWTVRNAASFGGDASRITLCGWSAGAASVTYHLYSPAAKGLFHNAIIMSGTMTQSWAFDYDPDRCGRKYLQANDVTSHEQLQDLPLDQLMELSHGSRVIYFSLYHFCFMPSDDSYRLEPDLRFVGKDPFELVRSTAPVSDVPLLVGYTALEQSNLYYDGDFSNTSANFPNTNATVYELIGKYFDRWATAAGNRSMSRRRFYQELVGISDIIYGIQYFIRHTATHQKAPLYRYLFAYDGAFGYAKNVYYRNQLTRPNLTGPMHGDDLGYLFTPYLYRGKDQQDIVDAGYQTERRVQRRMLRLWSNFIKYGNPTPEPEPGRDRNDTDGGRQPVRWYPYNDPDPKRARHYLRIGRRNQLLPEADEANPLHQIWKPVFQCLYEFDCDFLSAEVDD
ncbi:juvenile hormone esterase-like [Anopheles nili]|uniref:juvenile hormone esterase-like n=1 Tax=Anopheles nili TaxID=185578 RepID=UPI00237A55F6|nr:juvenile hormone esterase-like [Anopheles nili]